MTFLSETLQSVVCDDLTITAFTNHCMLCRSIS